MRRRRTVGGWLLAAALGVACGGTEHRSARVETGIAGPAAVQRIDPPAAAGSLAPNLAVADGELLMTWLEPLDGARHRLVLARLGDGGWGAPSVVAEGGGFFANWADRPAVAEGGDGALVAHWLAKTAPATYAYSIFLARSTDGGATWSDLGPLNDDATATEHGFVSYLPEPGGVRAFWLDGRAMEGGGDMGLRTALVGEAVGSSELLDERTCECCATDAARGAAGALVVYRDRGGDETRDTAIVRRAADGWTEPATAAADGWTIAGCPVNGPAVAADTDTVALAWYTAAGQKPRVRLALSKDGGRGFGPAVAVDSEAPAGRVDLVLDGAGGVVVSWLAVDREVGSVRLRRVSAAGRLGVAREMARTGAGRASGFPRLERLGDTLFLAWVDTGPAEGSRLRALAVPLDDLPAPS